MPSLILSVTLSSYNFKLLRNSFALFDSLSFIKFLLTVLHYCHSSIAAMAFDILILSYFSSPLLRAICHYIVVSVQGCI